jgi:ribosomal protein L24E
MIKTIFKTQDHKYPLMRDPQRNPRCYEFTDKEREEATQRVDQLLRERAAEHSQGYYGA